MSEKKRGILSFESMVRALEGVPSAQKAAIRVHDDLDIARSIAQDLFGSLNTDLIFKIRELLVEEEEHVDANSSVERRVVRK